MALDKLSSISVIGTRQYFSSHKRLDVYFVHPDKIDAYAYIRNIAETTGLKLDDLERLLVLKPASGRGSKEQTGSAMVIKPGLLSSDFLINTDNAAWTTDDDFNASEKGQLKNGDILVLSAAHAAGYIGKNTSIFLTSDDTKAICIGELIRLRSDNKKINPYYLLAYLNNQKVRLFFQYSVRGQTVHLYPNDIRKIPVILPPRKIQDSIGNKLKRSIEAKLEARKKKKDIDEIFAKYLPVHFEVSNEISFGYRKMSCVIERRTDPKSFSPRLATFIKRLRNFGYEINTIDELKRSHIHRGIQPEYHINGSIPVIKTRNVNDSPIDWEATSKTNNDFYQRNDRAQIPQNALAVTSTGEGSWGRTSISNKSGAIGDGHITIIPIDETLIDPYYVCAFLWTKYGKAQYDKRVRGCTGQTEIYPFDIRTIEIPRIGEKPEFTVGENLRTYIKLSEESRTFHQEAMFELEKLLSTDGGA